MPKMHRTSLPEGLPKSKVPVSLRQILDDTTASLPPLRTRLAELERAAALRPAPPSFAGALRGPSVALIAEVKRRSPSMGTINAEIDPADRAAAYARAGASAISVLTDGPHFGGSIDDLRAATARVHTPVIRKDFILDEAQIVEARGAGAAAVLLIVRALSPARLGELLACARAHGLDALVEVHEAGELDVALASGATVIGVNSRNLDTFAIDVPAAWRLLSRIPADRIAVAESGMAVRADVEAAAAAGADAVLVGTALSSLGEPDAAVRALTGVPRRGR